MEDNEELQRREKIKVASFKLRKMVERDVERACQHIILYGNRARDRRRGKDD